LPVKIVDVLAIEQVTITDDKIADQAGVDLLFLATIRQASDLSALTSLANGRISYFRS
jgi:hypothetical protein